MGTILPLLFLLLHKVSSTGFRPSYSDIFLDSISPQQNTVFGGSFIDDGGVSSHNGGFGGNNFFFPQQPQVPVGVPQGIPQAQPNSQQQPLQQDPSTLGCGTPPQFCTRSKYRTYDGSCNNLRNPVLGTPNTRYQRLLPQNYGDGISTPTAARSGNPLPSARVVSLTVYPDVPIEDPIWTLNAMQYGQIITHDMSMIAGSTQAQPHSTKCCSPQGKLLPLADSPDHCFPIVLPDDDPAYGQTGTQCLNFVRTITDRDRNCVGGTQPAEQLTAVNHYLDLSIVYGNNDQVNQQVREFNGGRLRIEQRNGQDWPPRNQNASGVCTIQNPFESCYFAGDTRVNQNPQLTVLQIVLLREHNRIANVLAQLNPHWNDETIFQEARKINIGQHQHITYYEWLPIFIGSENSLKNKIIWQTKSFVNDYNENIDPSIINEHATAAFRYFHTLIAGQLDLVQENRNSYGSIRMSDWFNRPAILEQGDNFDDLSRGLNTQPQLAADPYHDSEITQFLFRGGQQFGSDLKAICIQRNRDHGLASYNDVRQYCGLPKARSFQDFSDVMTQESVQKLAALYEQVDDVDLTVGGSLETLVPGTLSGPTFLCILTEQFYRTRVGDRFFYENAPVFTLPQLNEIRKASISRLLCDNGRNIRSMQPRGFERISSSNAVVPCESLPTVDLSLWIDNGGQSGQYPTNSGGFGGPDVFFKK